MCGIFGAYHFQENQYSYQEYKQSLQTLHQRGENNSQLISLQQVCLGHTRLSIIDPSEKGNQPMVDETNRYWITYNGEIYNHKELRKQLEQQGVSFQSDTDTEVLLKLFITEGIHSCLEKLNGFFAFAIYDNTEKQLFLARDRFGIKPLLYYKDDNRFLFASEMKALIAAGIPKKIKNTSLHLYFQLGYIPAPETIFEDTYKIDAGELLIVKDKEVNQESYYKIPIEKKTNNLREVIEDAVIRRLVADVPLGSFLSGGIDSSIITGIAAKHKSNLHTFSIGYKDEPFFDETSYAEIAAKQFKTHHHSFQLSNQDLFEHLYDILDYIDEPFGDSSAIAVFILSKLTKQEVTVALSGDGADELFGGYNKHRAELLIRKYQSLFQLFSISTPLLKLIPKSRNHAIFNNIRQLDKLVSTSKYSLQDRYWNLASFMPEQQVRQLLRVSPNQDYFSLKKDILSQLTTTDFNAFLTTDIQLPLKNDMLHKVDSMSMAHSLEIRVPFLDHTVVEAAMQIPSHQKLNTKKGKLILREIFQDLLPYEILNRSKKGFEVPLLKWFRKDLKNLIFADLLEESWIQEQGIFNLQAIQHMRQKLESNNPGDIQNDIWRLIVFQYWYKKHMN